MHVAQWVDILNVVTHFVALVPLWSCFYRWENPSVCPPKTSRRKKMSKLLIGLFSLICVSTVVSVAYHVSQLLQRCNDKHADPLFSGVDEFFSSSLMVFALIIYIDHLDTLAYKSAFTLIILVLAVLVILETEH